MIQFFLMNQQPSGRKLIILMLDGDCLLCVDLCHVFMLTILLDLSVISIKFQFQKFIESIAE